MIVDSSSALDLIVKLSSSINNCPNNEMELFDLAVQKIISEIDPIIISSFYNGESSAFEKVCQQEDNIFVWELIEEVADHLEL